MRRMVVRNAKTSFLNVRIEGLFMKKFSIYVMVFSLAFLSPLNCYPKGNSLNIFKKIQSAGSKFGNNVKEKGKAMSEAAKQGLSELKNKTNPFFKTLEKIQEVSDVDQRVKLTEQCNTDIEDFKKKKGDKSFDKAGAKKDLCKKYDDLIANLQTSGPNGNKGSFMKKGAIVVLAVGVAVGVVAAYRWYAGKKNSSEPEAEVN